MLEQFIVTGVPFLVWLEHISDLDIFLGRAGEICLLSHRDQSRDECPFGADFLVDGAEGGRAGDVGNYLAPHVAVRATATQAADVQGRRRLLRCLETITNDERQSFEHCARDMLPAVLERQPEKRAPRRGVQERHALPGGRKVGQKAKAVRTWRLRWQPAG